jgi:hypothetical protein
VLGDLDGLVGPALDGVTSSVHPLEQCLSIRDRPGPGGIDAPEIFGHFDVRLAPDIGWLTGTRKGAVDGGEARIDGWTCFADGSQPDSTSLMLFADAFPPAVLDYYRAGWVPSEPGPRRHGSKGRFEPGPWWVVCWRKTGSSSTAPASWWRCRASWPFCCPPPEENDGGRRAMLSP